MTEVGEEVCIIDVRVENAGCIIETVSKYKRSGWRCAKEVGMENTGCFK